MKKAAFILGSIVLASCGAPNESVGPLEELQAQKDSLVAARATLDATIASVEAQLTALDTNENYDRVTSIEVQPTNFEHYFDVFVAQTFFDGIVSLSQN